MIDQYGIAVVRFLFPGSTPMGGGTVAFPVLVLFFGELATMGRDFSFAVQSVGMTRAADKLHAAVTANASEPILASV